MAFTFKSVLGAIGNLAGKVLGGGTPAVGGLGSAPSNRPGSVTPIFAGIGGGQLQGTGMLGGLPFELPGLSMPNTSSTAAGNPALGALGQIAQTADAIANIWGGSQYSAAAAQQATALATASMPGVIATPDGIMFTGSGNKGGGAWGDIGGGFTLGGSFGASGGNNPGLLAGLPDWAKVAAAAAAGWLLLGRRRF